MNKKNVIKITVVALVSFVLICAICLAVVIHRFLSREYMDDMEYKLTDDKGVLIIKRWTWLVADGAEVYYKRDWKSASVHLGSILFSSDYEIQEKDENSVCISWGKDRTETFALPEDVPLAWPVIVLPIGGALLLAGGAAVVLLRRKKKPAPVAAEE